MNIKCPNCGMEYEVERKDFGSFVTCESCGKGFVIGAKSTHRAGVSDSTTRQAGEGSVSSIAAWICVVVLVLNLAALITLCCLMEGGFAKTDMEMVKIYKSIDAMNEDLSSSASSLGKKVDEIYDRMGRMKLY